MEKRRKKIKYTSTLPQRMYAFFRSYDGAGAPSFLKFAVSIGATVEDIGEFRRHKEFDRAYKECSEIRRDYLLDRALTKRFDASFVKFLLSEGETEVTDGGVDIRLEVIES